MADFRRCILAFAVVTLLLGLLPTASAQVVNGVTVFTDGAALSNMRLLLRGSLSSTNWLGAYAVKSMRRSMY